MKIIDFKLGCDGSCLDRKHRHESEFDRAVHHNGKAGKGMEQLQYLLSNRSRIAQSSSFEVKVHLEQGLQKREREKERKREKEKKRKREKREKEKKKKREKEKRVKNQTNKSLS